VLDKRDDGRRNVVQPDGLFRGLGVRMDVVHGRIPRGEGDETSIHSGVVFGLSGRPATTVRNEERVEDPCPELRGYSLRSFR
jgi:hypothetical protein